MFSRRTERSPAPPPNATPPRLMALVFTDMVGSVDLKRRLGDAAFAGMLRRHDELFKLTLGASADYVKDTGDGFLATCGSASAAVNAALAFQLALNLERFAQPIRVRIGIHLGEVSQLDMEDAGVPKLSGLAVDIAGRIMSLAGGGQILLTKAAFDGAKQYVREHPPVANQDDGFNLPDIRWQTHGMYMFRGLDEPVEVFEVGAVGIAPLSQPPDSEKVRRAITELGPSRSPQTTIVSRARRVGTGLAIAAGFAATVYFGRQMLGGAQFAGASLPSFSMSLAAGPTPTPTPKDRQPRLPQVTVRRNDAPTPHRPGENDPNRPPPPGPPPPRPEDVRPAEGPIGLVQVRMDAAPTRGQRARITGYVLNRDEYAQLRMRIKPPPGVPEPAYDLRVDAMAVAQQIRDHFVSAGVRGVQVNLRAAEGAAGAAAIQLVPSEQTPPDKIERAKRIAEAFVLDDHLVEVIGP